MKADLAHKERIQIVVEYDIQYDGNARLSAIAAAVNGGVDVVGVDIGEYRAKRIAGSLKVKQVQWDDTHG